jgi:hypothetical protein
VVTRRALLGAGAVALLAGCGPPEQEEVVPADVLRKQLEATQKVIIAYKGDPRLASLLRNAEARERRISAALERSRTGPVDAELTETGTQRLEAALAAESAALREHVAAVGLLSDREARELLGGLVADSATNEAALLELLDRPLPTAFPGEPVA